MTIGQTTAARQILPQCINKVEEDQVLIVNGSQLRRMMADPTKKFVPVRPEELTKEADIIFSLYEKKKNMSDSHAQNRSTKTHDRRRFRAGRVMSSVLFYCLIVCVIGSAFVLSQGSRRSVMGYYFMNVLTWSMEPEIPQGSMVITKRTDPAAIQVGDDITYMKDENTTITHRVIGITENFDNSGARGFETQGIDSSRPDFEIVPAINVVGVVKFHVPRLGNWLAWLREHLFVTLLFVAGFILLIVFIRGMMANPHEGRQPSSVPGKHAPTI